MYFLRYFWQNNDSHRRTRRTLNCLRNISQHRRRFRNVRLRNLSTRGPVTIRFENARFECIANTLLSRTAGIISVGRRHRNRSIEMNLWNSFVRFARCVIYNKTYWPLEKRKKITLAIDKVNSERTLQKKIILIRFARPHTSCSYKATKTVQRRCEHPSEVGARKK